MKRSLVDVLEKPSKISRQLEVNTKSIRDVLENPETLREDSVITGKKNPWGNKGRGNVTWVLSKDKIKTLVA